MTGPIVQRISVTAQVGSDRMAASDDPIFLGLRGPFGREFRLAPAHGKAWRRGAKEVYVLGGADASVAHRDLNDPTRPAIPLAAVTAAYLRKGMEPIPNVRGLGEMDDRLQLDWVEVELHAEGAAPRLFARREGFWLGLVCGQFIDIPPVEGSG